jgi:hypothetical protein
VKTPPKLPGINPDNVMTNAFAIPMAAGLAIIHPAPEGGFHAEFYEGTGNSSGTYERTLSGAVREAKRFSREYRDKRDRRGTIRELMRQLAAQL